SHFLSRAAVGLASAGGVPLLAPGQHVGNSLGLEGWDQILLADNPGQTTLYAFTRADGQRESLQKRLDDLAKSLAVRGVFQRPVTLVSVAVLDSIRPLEPESKLANVLPSAFYAGLRPVTWVVDLGSGSVRKSANRAFPGAGALEAAALES